MRIKWLGHACFQVFTSRGVVLIDPFLSQNPLSPVRPSEVEASVIVVTHDHFDHLGDAVEVARRTGAKVVAVPELAASLGEVGAVAINMGSLVEVSGVEVGLFPAFHTCGRGAPASCVIRADGGTVYHAGDTALFGDMRLIGELYRPDAALLPIGGYYTMGPREAAYALTLVRPRVAIPMHYATFPVLVQDPSAFVEEAKRLAPEVKVVVLRPGESYEL